MSFKVQPASPAQPNRCQLFGPGSRPAIFEKMAASAADVINLDLEDSVAPDDKAEARASVIKAVNEIDWATRPSACALTASTPSIGIKTW
jgi:malyl-CoA/(S)-citramalyl-CoA lyase